MKKLILISACPTHFTVDFNFSITIYTDHRIVTLIYMWMIALLYYCMWITVLLHYCISELPYSPISFSSWWLRLYLCCCRIALTKQNFTLKYDTNIPRQVVRGSKSRPAHTTTSFSYISLPLSPHKLYYLGLICMSTAGILTVFNESFVTPASFCCRALLGAGKFCQFR